MALAGHGSTGKTTLLENILAAGGKIPKAELVSSGKTVSDYTPEEKEKGISVHTTLSSVEWNSKKINILDTPGASDFVGEVVAAFRTAETGIMVVGADTGVQIETIKLWRRLKMRDMPRLVFINKMDKERADYSKVLSDLSSQFDSLFVPVSFPMGEGETYKGIVDLDPLTNPTSIPQVKKKKPQTFQGNIPRRYPSIGKHWLKPPLRVTILLWKNTLKREPFPRMK